MRKPSGCWPSAQARSVAQRWMWRLISFGGINDQAFAWLEVREETT